MFSVFFPVEFSPGEGNMTTAYKEKIVIDTDCGIDDAIALILACSSKDIAEILAITCCFGNTTEDNVCENVKRVLTVCNEKDIPIHRGCKGPLIKHNLPPTVHGDDGLGNCGSQYSTGEIEESTILASAALINLAKNHKSQLTVIALGPLTNIAIAHRIDPDFFHNLKSLVIMGGNYKGIGNTSPVAEFNFYCDPEAANIVVSESKTKIIMVPWETTMEYGIQWNVYDDLIKINTKKGNFFADFTAFPEKRAKLRGKRQLFDCDFLAVVACLYPQCVTGYLENPLAVECDGALTRGLTVLLNSTSPDFNKEKNITIVTSYSHSMLNTLRKKMLNS